MKGVLRHADGICYLSPRLTYVGREGCDIIIRSPFVDSQHAVFEYNEESGCFILQDLNSSQGTYVNDCRIQNAAVRLAHHDVVRFGFNGPVYQLELDEASVPPKQVRPAHLRGDPYNPPAEKGLPVLGSSAATSSNLQPLWMQSSVTGTPAMQHQQQQQHGVRTRPATAGSWRAVTFADMPSGAVRVGSQQLTTATNGSSGSGDQSSRPAGASDDLLRTLAPSPKMPGFVNFEAEMEMKNQLIEQLTSELTRTRQKLQASLATIDDDAVGKLPLLEQELEAKKNEITALKGQLQQIASEQSKRDAAARDIGSGKMQEICDLRNELERVRKDKNITSGLVTQMQRDMASKDVTISRLTREIESLKKEVRDRDVQIATSGARRGARPIRDEQEGDASNKSIAMVTNQLKIAEGKLQSQTEVSNGLRNELERAKQNILELQEASRKLRTEADSNRAQLTDVHRAERMARVDLEQAVRKYERLHNRVVQVAYSMPGTERPSHEVKDDELMDALRKTIDERSDMLRQIADLQDRVRALADGDERAGLALRRLEEHLAAAQERLKSTGLLAACLRQEMTLLQTLSADGNESVRMTKGHLLSFLALQLSWQQDIDSALEKAGIYAKLSRDPTRKHVEELTAKWRQCVDDKEAAEKLAGILESRHLAEVESLRRDAKQELSGRVADAVDKARDESEIRHKRELDELRQAEEERREQAIEVERRRAEELENSIIELRQSLLDQQAADRERMDSFAETSSKLDEMMRNEEEMKRKLQVLESLKEAEVKALLEQLEDAKQGNVGEIGAYKEQIGQHAAIVHSLEEKVAKVSRKNKDLSSEVAELKQTIKELKSRPKAVVKEPTPPPKPQVIVQKELVPDTSSLSTIAALRSECTELKKKLQEQVDVVMGLRRDLASASARLQDSRGSLTEEQKQALEASRALAAQKERQVLELQQQMAKLSHIIDHHAQEIREREVEISKLKSELLKWRGEAEASADSARSLEQQLTAKQAAARRDEESRVEAELTSIGAACRGERHAQVLERQREALAELRRRVRELETQRPGTPSGAAQQADVALQQAAVVKRELEELRTSHALEERSRQEISSMAAVERAVSRARGITPATDAEAELERSAHRQTSVALDESEKSYMAVVKAVAEALDISHPVEDSVRSIAHIPMDEVHRVAEQRERLSSMLASKVKAMCERLSHKDQLLSDYERDLAKLRRAEELVSRKSQQVDALADEVQRRLDEVMYLRETLGRTKERLFQEKRLNSAIKQKKTYHLECEAASLLPSGAHQCAAEDPFAKDAAKKKKQLEKLKKKNYEIRMLKDEVARQDVELYHATTKLGNVSQHRAAAHPQDGDGRSSDTVMQPKRHIAFA